MQIKELWHISPAESQLINRDGDKQPDEVIIQSAYSLISLGTEKLISRGLVPESLHHEMKVPYMKGAFTFPCTYGYSLSGYVKHEDNSKTSKAVHVMHPHANYACIQPDDMHTIPEDIPLKRAVLASNMETIVNAIWDSHVSIGDRILIAGFGMIGAMLALTLRSFPGLEVWVVEKDEKRMQQAQALNIPVLSPEEPVPYMFDLAFNCSANAQGLQYCIDRTLPEATVVELSWYGNAPVTIDLGGAFHAHRKNIRASQVSNIPAHKSAQWDYNRRKDLVFQLLKNPEYDKLITRVVDFEQAPNFFNELRHNQNHDIGVVIKYEHKPK